MMRLLLNGLGASAASGLTYLYNVVPQLSAQPDVGTIVLVQPSLRKEFERFPRIELPRIDTPLSVAGRFFFEQRKLPGLIYENHADVLLSTGNFALRHSPVPQILLSGNSLYTSADFRKDLWRRREYAMLLHNEAKALVARKSLRWADVTVAPSQAFADDLYAWTGKKTAAIHHGFDPALFFDQRAQLADAAKRALTEHEGCLKLLYVSHYNYYRNFETLLRALPIIRESIKPRNVRLFLTCQLRDGANPGSYKPSGAARLIETLGIREEVIELGAVPYRSIHHSYRVCDLYVTPAYTETFAHPVVEAMASGLPVIASDLPVHREIAGSGALFFPTFSPKALAETVVRVATCASMAKSLSDAGLSRAKEFSWSNHVSQLLQIAASISGMERTLHATSAA